MTERGVELKPGWLSRDAKHAAYTVAAEARDAARKRFEAAQRAMMDAELEWDRASREATRTFRELADADGENVPPAKEG